MKPINDKLTYKPLSQCDMLNQYRFSTLKESALMHWHTKTEIKTSLIKRKAYIKHARNWVQLSQTSHWRTGRTKTISWWQNKTGNKTSRKIIRAQHAQSANDIQRHISKSRVNVTITAEKLHTTSLSCSFIDTRQDTSAAKCDPKDQQYSQGKE